MESAVWPTREQLPENLHPSRTRQGRSALESSRADEGGAGSGSQHIRCGNRLGEDKLAGPLHSCSQIRRRRLPCSRNKAMMLQLRCRRPPSAILDQTQAHKVVEVQGPLLPLCESWGLLPGDLEDDTHWMHCPSGWDCLCHFNRGNPQRPHIHLHSSAAVLDHTDAYTFVKLLQPLLSNCEHRGFHLGDLEDVAH